MQPATAHKSGSAEPESGSSLGGGRDPRSKPSSMPRATRQRTRATPLASLGPLESVWSLYLDAVCAEALKTKKAQRLVQAEGALLLFDDSEKGGVRVTVAGPQEGVRLARDALEALLVSALSACNHPDDTQATNESTQHAPASSSMAAAFASPCDYALVAYSPPAVPSGYDNATLLLGVGPADELVHVAYEVPHALVGLVIGVRGASIHAIEHVSSCHLSLDRSAVHVDAQSGVPFVLLHIHGPRAGAAAAVSMCGAIMERHLQTVCAVPPQPLAYVPMQSMQWGTHVPPAQPQPGDAAAQAPNVEQLWPPITQAQPPCPLPLPISLPTCYTPSKSASPITPESVLDAPRRWVDAGGDGNSSDASA